MCRVKISHDSHVASVTGEDFGSSEALIDSLASSAHLGRVGLVCNNLHNVCADMCKCVSVVSVLYKRLSSFPMGVRVPRKY